MFSRLSLRYRIALVIFMLEACMLAIVLSVTLNQSGQTAFEFDRDSQMASLSLLSNLSVTALLTGEYSDYQLYVDDVQKMPSIKHVLLADFHRRVVASTNVADVGRLMSAVLPQQQTGWQVQAIESAAGNLGTLAVHFSDSALTSTHHKTRNLAVFLAISGMLIIALVGLATGFALTRRLDTVAQAAVDFTRGDLQARSRLNGSDEVAHLSGNVDHMADVVVNQQKVMALEIEERKRSETALRESRLMLRHILDTLQHAVFWKDTRGVYLGCNQVFAEVFQLPEPDSVTGLTDADLPWPKAQVNSSRDIEWEVISQRQVKREIVCLSPKQNDPVTWFDMTRVPLVDESNHVYGVLGVCEDITEQKQSEEQRLQLESRLNQSQKMEAIGTLAGGIAHDFNNILGVILGYTEMALINAPADSRLINDLEKVHEAGNRARDLVKQILTFSRQSKVEPAPIQLQTIIRDTLKMLRSSLPTTIDIRTQIDPDCGTVMADATQVHQILMNLCTNAFHAMEEAGGILNIELRKIDLSENMPTLAINLDPGEYVELTVSDNGMGIGPDILDKIFDPYFTTKGQGKGTGMGLAIIHGIIRGYGGDITVDSVLGKGAAFHVYFPVVAQQAQVYKPEKADMPEGLERILVVDDELSLAQMSQEMLERLGYQVTVRQSSLEALSTFQNSPGDFDLIITDQTMPGITGTDLARRILQIRPDIPIILCTGYSNLVDEQSAKALGIREFAMKPLTMGNMAHLIRKVLDKPNRDGLQAHSLK